MQTVTRANLPLSLIGPLSGKSAIRCRAKHLTQRLEALKAVALARIPSIQFDASNLPSPLAGEGAPAASLAMSAPWADEGTNCQNPLLQCGRL